MAAFEGKLYLFGGWDGEQYLNSVYEYFPEEESWQAMTPMPTPRAFAGAAVSLGRIYVIGGENNRGPLTINEVYSPGRDNLQNNPWSNGESLPGGRLGMGAASVADVIYIFGGEGNNVESQAMLEYFPQSDEWHQVDSYLLNSWSQPGLVHLQTRLYIIGGQLSGVPSRQNLVYQAIYNIMFPVQK
jgi:N-acetylneuraminic acid mutarotase